MLTQKRVVTRNIRNDILEGYNSICEKKKKKNNWPVSLITHQLQQQMFYANRKYQIGNIGFQAYCCRHTYETQGCG